MEQTIEGKKIVARYVYKDRNGKPLYYVFRTDPKGFKQAQLDVPNDALIWNLDGVERVLYHLPEVIFSTAVWIVEGEKDVETMRQRGFVATTCSGGSGSWREEYNKYFRHKAVYIIPDNDDAGYRFANTVAKNLLPLALYVKIIYLPKPYADVSDWFGDMHTASQLKDMMQLTTRVSQLDFPPEPKPKIFPQFSYTEGSPVHKALQYPIDKLIPVFANDKAFCVNHVESVPSMDTRKGFCYCYSCLWHGNVIELYMKLYHVSFTEAVKEINKRIENENR